MLPLCLLVAAGAGMDRRADAGQLFSADFEAPAYAEGSVHGQRGWSVDQGRAEVVGEFAKSGSKSLKLYASTPFSQARLHLQIREHSPAAVFVDFHTRPAASEQADLGEMLDVDGARIGFFRSPEHRDRAEFWVFDGNPDSGGQWVRTGWSVEIDPETGLPDKWLRLTIREDFARQVWDVSVEGALVAANLAFVAPVVSGARSYIIMGDAQQPVYLDDLSLAGRNPLGADTDSDGMLDALEEQAGLNRFVDDRDIPGADGDRPAIAMFLSGNGSAGVVRPAVVLPDAPAVSAGSGYLDAPVRITLSAGGNHDILYTLDGSDPARATASAQLWKEPLDIGKTTVLRAVSRDSSGRLSRTVSRVWIFPGTALSQDRPEGWPQRFTDQALLEPRTEEFEVPFRLLTLPDEESAAVTGEETVAALRQGPVVSLVFDPADFASGGTGVYHHSSRTGPGSTVPASVSWWSAGGAQAEAESGAMASVTGESSRYHDVTLKHGFRIRLDNISSGFGKLLGGAGQPARQLVLRTPTQDSWAQGEQGGSIRREARYITDAWADGWLGALGYPSYRRTFVHLYVNGLYWGVYEAVEQSVPSSAGSALLTASDDPGWPVMAIQGAADAWQQWLAGLRNLAQLARERNAPPDQWKLALERSDAKNLIDYVLLNLWMGNHDWPARNYLIRDDGARFRFQNWDAEFGFHFGANRESDHFFRLSEVLDGPAAAFVCLCHFEEFRKQVGGRVAELTSAEGALSQQRVRAGYGLLADQFRPLLAAETARWGTFYDPVHATPGFWEKNVQDVPEVLAPLRSRALVLQWQAYEAGFARKEAQWEAAAESRRLAAAGPQLAFPDQVADVVRGEDFDSDGDGLPDAWEREHGLDPGNPEDAMGDLDGDGLNNLEEHLLGLDPAAGDDASSRRWKGFERDQTSPLTHGLPKDPEARLEALRSLSPSLQPQGPPQK